MLPLPVLVDPKLPLPVLVDPNLQQPVLGDSYAALPVSIHDVLYVHQGEDGDGGGKDQT